MSAPTTFADFLRAAREKAGLTQAALASKCRLTGSYISLLESGKKPAPSDRVVKRLAGALSLPPEEALEVAHFDRAPEDLRRALERLRRQAAREQSLRERTAEAVFPFSVWNLMPLGLPGRGRGGALPSLEAEIVHAIDHLVEMARTAPDLSALREESRRVLESLPPEKRRKILDAVPVLLDGAGEEGGRRLVPAPGPGLPPDILPGDVLVLDPSRVPEPGDVVFAAGTEGPSLSRWVAGGSPGAAVVVEVRRRMK
jgi:transcriptional regulator with XRE-family HTH domain